MRWIKDKYETHHWIKITDSAIERAVDLSIKYMGDRKLPDKAIDLMDEALSSKNKFYFKTSWSWYLTKRN